jgi:hypothetical protein
MLKLLSSNQVRALEGQEEFSLLCTQMSFMAGWNVL